MRDACRRGGISPGSLQYVESHSSASPIGDATELNALGAVLQTSRQPDDKCAIGSVKTNIGHLEGAAGMAGLMKVVLMLRHRTFAPSLHFEKPNPHVTFATLPLHVQQQLQPWPQKTGPRIAGVSGSGFGGVNAHVVLEEAIDRRPASDASPASFPLLLSARTDEALKELALRYVALLDKHPDINLADVCFTASTGRTHFSHRLALTADSVGALRARLVAFVAGQTAVGWCTGIVKRGASVKSGGDSGSIPAEAGERYVHGLPIDATKAFNTARRLPSMPSYPFQRQRHWVTNARIFTSPGSPQEQRSTPPEPQEARPSSREIVAPRSDVESALVQMWREILGTRQIGITDNFFELGGGSIMAIELFTRIEQVFGVRPPPAILFEKPTIAELASVIATPVPAAPGERLLSAIRVVGDQAPIFLLTPGHLFQFTALSRRLTAAHPIYVGAFPERFSTPGITIQEIAGAYLNDIKRICPAGNFHLFGFCAGGIVAFEIAQQLRLLSRPPASIGMVDSPCPPPGHVMRRGRLGYFASRIGAHAHAVRQLPLRDAARYVFSRGKFLPMVLRIPGFRTSRPEQLVTVAHREAVQRYEPQPYPLPVDLYLAEEPWPSAAEDSRLLWRDLAPEGRTLRFPGVHDGLLKAPRVFEIADRLNEVLANRSTETSMTEAGPAPVAPRSRSLACARV